MKNLMALVLATFTFFSVQTVSAFTINIRQLSCSGLGLASGYTTINLVPGGKFSITSVKYFQTSSDANVIVRDQRIAANGFVEIDLYSPALNADWTLILTAPAGNGHFITRDGTDVLYCKSRIEAF